MNTTDLDVLERFQTVVGVGRIYNYRKEGTSRPGIKKLKRSWQWQAHGEAALRTADMLEPWLGKRRIKAVKDMRRGHKTLLPAEESESL